MYNILICDDEPDIVSALKIYLTGDEYQLFEAYNGRQALETVESNEIQSGTAGRRARARKWTGSRPLAGSVNITICRSFF